MFLGPGLEQGRGSRQRQDPMACQLGHKQPVRGQFSIGIAKDEAKMPNPVGQGLGEAGAIQSGWGEVDPGVPP